MPKIDLRQRLPEALIGLAFALGFSERLFDRVLSTLGDPTAKRAGSAPN